MKKILVLVLILLMISTPVFADAMAALLTMGALFGGIGGLTLALAPDWDFMGYTSIGLGGMFVLFGLIAGIADYIAEAEAPSDGLYLVNTEGEAPSVGFSPVSQNDTVSLKVKDSIFDHLLLETDGRNTYIGYRFSW